MTLSITVTGFLFFTLGYYKPKIEQIIYNNTGYKVKLGSLKTNLNERWLPQIVINQIGISKNSDVAEDIHIDSVQLVVSFSSIWNFTPIFDTIIIKGTSLTLIRNVDGTFSLNKLPLIATNEATTSKKFDLEAWILKNSNIKLSKIDFSFIDNQQSLPQIYTPNITINLQNSYSNKHVLNITIPNITPKNTIETGVYWVGNTISQPQKLKEVSFVIKTYNNERDKNDKPFNKLSQKLNSIKRLLSGSNILKNLDAQTTANAKFVDGQLMYFHANFDITDLIIPFKTRIDIPILKGNIDINLNNNNQYNLNATKLNIASKDGYILQNQNITGNYFIDHNGSISIKDINMLGINKLLFLFPSTKDLQLTGIINSITTSWNGNIFKPKDYTTVSKFQGIGISSKNKNVPNINNISGDIAIFTNQGKLHLTLNDSTLLYNKIFLVPYKFKKVDSNITWNNNKDQTITFNLLPTNLIATDFNCSLNGKYIYKKNTSGFLELNAHLNKILAKKVGDYLPTSIPESVHKWLNSSLLDGYATNANLLLQGWLVDFPFSNNKGKFYIDADVENAKLKYAEEWPSIDSIYAKFMIRNQKIIIKTNNARINGNNLTDATAVIPDMTANHVYLTIDGMANGTTSNFMTYLKQTPVNKMIGKIPETIITTGNGNLDIHLNVPFDNPEKTKVNGFYIFDNNSLTFDLPVPELKQVNGKLFFTNNGLTIDGIQLRTLDSNIKLSAKTANNGNMHFIAQTDNLNYKELSKYYLPIINPIISGSSSTNIAFDINQNGFTKLTANSDLYGVNIDVASPLSKTSEMIAPFKFDMKNIENQFNIDFAYKNNILRGNLVLDDHGYVVNSQMAIGNEQLNLPQKSLSAKFKINTNLPKIQLLDWLNSVKQIINQDTKPNSEKNAVEPAKNKQSNVIEKNDLLSKKSDFEKNDHLFPIELYLKTQSLLLGNTDLGQTEAKCIIKKTDTQFDINATMLKGIGNYNYSQNLLTLNLDTLKINNSNTLNTLTKINNGQNMALIYQQQWSLPPECDAIIKTQVSNVQQKDDDFDNTENNAQKCYKVLHKLSKNKSKSQQNSYLNPAELPAIDFKSKDVFYQQNNLGKLTINLIPQKQDLILNTSTLINDDATITFNGVNYCVNCDNFEAFVSVKTNIKVKNLGNLLNRLNINDVVQNGEGNISIQTEWEGQFSDFNINNIIAHVKLDIKSGKFLKTNTGSVLGSILGIINLQSIVNLAKLNFTSVFSNGFSFDTLKLNAYMVNNKLGIESLQMEGTLATVSSHGNINLTTNSLDLYLSVTPHLGTGVAVGAAIATGPLGIIVGPVVYITELVLKQPINKLFTFSYRVTGTLQKPTLTQIGTTQQIIKNVSSTIGK